MYQAKTHTLPTESLRWHLEDEFPLETGPLSGDHFLDWSAKGEDVLSTQIFQTQKVTQLGCPFSDPPLEALNCWWLKRKSYH